LKRLIKKSFFDSSIGKDDLEFIDNLGGYKGSIEVKLNEQGLEKNNNGEVGRFDISSGSTPDVVAFVRWEIDDLEDKVEDYGEINPDYRGSKVLFIDLIEVRSDLQQTFIFKYLLERFDELVVKPMQDEYDEYLFLHAEFANEKLQEFINRMSNLYDLKWLDEYIDEVTI
jgi:hypothetical protein